MLGRRALPLVLLPLVLALACQKADAPPGDAKPAAAKSDADPKPAEAADAKPAEAADAKPADGDAKPEADAKPAGDPAGPSAEARPMYYERPITPEDLEGRTLRELNLMRNTIYARVGQQFRKRWLSDYFTAQPWYQPADEADRSKLSDLDLKNAEAIVDYERAFTPAHLRERRDALNEKMRGDKATPEDTIEFQLIAALLGEWEGGDAIVQEKRSPLEDPDRLDEILAVEDLDDMSLRDLRILRNTIYARRGRAFRSDLLSGYFADKSWYAPKDDYTDKLLTATDRKNIRVIKSVEDSLGGPITDWGHMMEEGWFYGA